MYLIPEIMETERLLLRKPKAEDWEDLHDYYGDEECMRYTVGRAQEDWETWRRVAVMIGHWEIRQYGPYVMIDKQKHNVLGPIGLWYPLGWPSPEIKWGIARRYQKQGYTKEAAAAVRKMAAEHLPDLHLISLIYPENAASIALAKSIGAKYEETIPFRGSKADIYRHVKGMDA